MQYITLISFLFIFYKLIRKDTVFIIPFILLIYTLVNGLLSYEDFSLYGGINFGDYGLLLSLGLLVHYAIGQICLPKAAGSLSYLKKVHSSMLFKILLAIFFYYGILFCYSVYLQGAEWPVKIGRYTFYGITIFLFYFLLKENPIIKYNKLINVFKYITLFFGVLYIAYNAFGIDVFRTTTPWGFTTTAGGIIKRNYEVFPIFTSYFFIYFLDNIFYKRGKMLFNIFALIVLAFCVLFTYTRGLIIMLSIVSVLAIFNKKNWPKSILYLVLIVVGLSTLVFFSQIFISSQFLVILQRFSEFGSTGVLGATNFQVRMDSLVRSVQKVLDYNPLFGFAFLNPTLVGYKFQWFPSAGSPDNTITNIIGTNGFGGLILYLALIFYWIKTNLSLQALKLETFSRVHFLFIIFMLGFSMNSGEYSYLQNFGLFLMYDLLAYHYLTNKKAKGLKINSGP